MLMVVPLFLAQPIRRTTFLREVMESSWIGLRTLGVFGLVILETASNNVRVEAR